MYTINEVKKVQKRLLEMAKAIRNVLEKNDIPYFITYGTLLGAVRHKGFIPWDDDFDFYLFDDSYDKALQVLREELTPDMFVEYFDSEPLYFHDWAHVKDLNTVATCVLFPQDGHYAHKGISIDLYKTTLIKEEDEKCFKLVEHLKYLNRRRKVNLISDDEFNKRVSSVSEDLKHEEERLQSLDGRGRDVYDFPSSYNTRIFPEELFPLKKYVFEDTYFYGPNSADNFLKGCYNNYMELPPESKREFHYSDVQFLSSTEKLL
jgi:lipopolysaccharide cholinephosphotransferase